MSDSDGGADLARRRALGRALTVPAVFAFSSTTSLSAPKRLPRPAPGQFQTGDFVWPKVPGAYVPYNSGSSNNTATDRNLWAIEKARYLRANEDARAQDSIALRRLELLREMDYREFIAVYAGAQQLGQPGVYGGGAVYVGHVGIIEIDLDGVAWVIEALMQKGVVRTRYADWIAGRADAAVWLGRLRGIPADKRAGIVRIANEQIGKPYDFWNFDLSDDSSFYCSKLAWLACFRALNISLDEDATAKRLLWFSPKQFLNLPIVEKIHDPGPF